MLGASAAGNSAMPITARNPRKLADIVRILLPGYRRNQGSRRPIDLGGQDRPEAPRCGRYRPSRSAPGTERAGPVVLTDDLVSPGGHGPGCGRTATTKIGFADRT
jgi:hypothetical protein